jgi:hypothetical protein
MSHTNVPDKTKLRLWVAAGGRCQYPGCNKPLYRDDLTLSEMNRSNIAHIIADSPEGPRGDAFYSEKLAAEFSNLMLLCYDHHHLIDHERLDEHPPEALRTMKAEHERRIEMVTGIQNDSRRDVASHRFPMYQSRNGDLLPEYAWRYFSTPRGKYDLSIASPGGAGRNKTLGQEEFKRLKIPVPPVEHQRTAVAILSTVDRAMEQTKRLIETKRKLKKGLAQQLLTGKRRLPGFGGPWTTHKIDTISNTSKGAGGSRADLVPEGLPVVRYGELYTTFDVRIDEAVSFLSHEAAKRCKPIRRGDVLLAGSGEDRIEIGKAATYMNGEPAYAGGDIVIVTPTDANSVFLAYLLDSNEVRREFYRRAQGESVVHLYMKEVASLELRLPPIEEQSRIATVLSTADRAIAVLEKKLAVLEELKRGLMQKLLNPSETET